jgi:hypothetical protein
MNIDEITNPPFASLIYALSRLKNHIHTYRLTMHLPIVQFSRIVAESLLLFYIIVASRRIVYLETRICLDAVSL